MHQFPIPRILIFFSIGIALADLLRHSEVMPVFSGIILLLTLIVTYILRKKEIIASTTLLTASIFLGMFVMSVDWKGKHVVLPEKEISYNAVITSSPILNNGKYSCDIVTTSFQDSYKLKAYIIADSTLHIGDQISCISRWNTPRNFTTSPHFDFALFLKRHGYAATTFISSATTANKAPTSDREATIPEGSTSGPSIPFREAIHLYPLIFRDKLLSILLPSHSTEDEKQSAAIIAAMVLGDKSQLSPETKQDYSSAGASHVLALSGLHISILLSILSILLRNVGVKTRMAIQLLFVWSFALLVGMPVSILRVAVMFTLLILVKSMGLINYSMNTLFTAAFIILLFSPQSLFDVGFQLSFAAVFFILIASRCLWSRVNKDIYNKHQRKLAFANILLVSFAAQLSTLPLILYHFGQFPIYFLITNICIGLFATIILSLGVLTIVVSFIPYIYTICQKVLIFTASTMNDYTHFIASLPCATVQDLYFNIPQVILCYILIFLLIKPFLPKKFVVK